MPPPPFKKCQCPRAFIREFMVGKFFDGCYTCMLRKTLWCELGLCDYNKEL